MRVRETSGRDEEATRDDHVTRVGRDVHSLTVRSNRSDRGPQPDVDTLLAQDVGEKFGVRRQVLREQTITPLHDRDLHTEAVERLGHLTRDRTPAGDHERVGRTPDVEEVLAGEHIDVADALDRRDERSAAGADEREPCAQGSSTDGDLSWPGHHRHTFDHVDTHGPEPVRVVIGRAHRSAHLVDSSPHRTEIHRGSGRRDAEPVRVAHGVGDASACDQRLRRHAAGPQAVATEAPLVDRCHPQPELTGGDLRRTDAGGTHPDHDEVELVARWRGGQSHAAVGLCTPER